MNRVKSGLGTSLFTAALAAATVIGAPQAVAATTPIGPTTVAGVQISPKADSATRRLASSDSADLRNAATVCGSGYRLLYGEALPDTTTRYGTLFVYTNGGTGPSDTLCAILDNNTPGSKWLKLKMCENKVTSPRCDVDANTYTDYAGPVYMNNCPTVTALMKSNASSSTYMIDAARSFCG
jgi:hypothetical protein